MDFPLNSVSPSKHATKDGAWNGEWSFESLITSWPMGIQMPEKLNPGPLAARITFFAPVSMLLVLSYVRHFVAWRFAFEKVVPVQLIYLVLFSASFFWKGFTGLAITIGAILTLFAVMQLTGRVDWSETFARSRTPSRAS